MKDIAFLATEEGYFLEYNNRFFKTSALLFNILKLNNEKVAIFKIKEMVLEQFDYSIEENEIVELIEKQEHVLQKSVVTHASYIYLKIELIKGNVLAFLSKAMVPLYKRFSFYMFCMVSLVLNVFFFTQIKFDFDINTFNVFIIYPLLLLSLLFHELGHASASASYGITPKTIGFGFYYVFPVFYSDVSKIWVLNKYKRIIVNLGGIYFQIIFINVLIVLCYLSGYTQLTYVIYINYLIILVSLNPFFRNDGYWILSDYFNIPNLQKEVKLFFVKLVSDSDYFKKYTKVQFYILALYTVCAFVSYIFIIIYIFNSLRVEYPKLLELFNASQTPVIAVVKANATFLFQITVKHIIFVVLSFKFIKKYVRKR